MAAEYQHLTSMELGRKRHALEEEMGKVEEEMNRRRETDRHIMRVSEREWKDMGEILGGNIKKGIAKRATLVSPELGFNVHNFAAFLGEIPPGGQEGAYHTHGEAVKFYLEGKGVEIIGDKQYEVEPGDAVFIPANTWHGTQNPGQTPLRILAVAHSGLGVPVCIQPMFKTREDLVQK